MDRQPRKILIVKLAGIGDVIQSLPLLRALNRSYPEARISWLSSPWAKDVLTGQSLIEEVIVYEPPLHSRGGKFCQLIDAVKALKAIRSREFDAAFIPHRTTMAAWLCRLAGIPVRVGFRVSGNSSLTVDVDYDASKPEVERNLDLARAMGITVNEDDRKIKLDFARTDDEYVRELLDGFGVKEKDLVVVIATGGAVNPGLELTIKCWKEEGFAYVADKLSERYGAKVILIGDRGDRKRSSQVAALMEHKPIDLTGRTNIPQLIALSEKAKLYIGNDSGPLYIAAAVGTPTVSIFGPTDPKLLAPVGPKHRAVFKEVECGPCFTPLEVYEHTLECDDIKCMEGIEPVEVLRVAEDLLEGSRDENRA